MAAPAENVPLKHRPIVMLLSLDVYKVKLITKIHAAASQEEVRCFIDNAIKTLQANKVDALHVSLFVNKLLIDLDACNPMHKDAQQWSNIQMARILLNRIKQQLNNPVH